jgi:hypothetical protein
MRAISAVEMAYNISLAMNSIPHEHVAHLAFPPSQSALLADFAHLPPSPLPLLPRQRIQTLRHPDLHADIPPHLGRPGFLLLVLSHVRSRQVGCCSSGGFCTDSWSGSGRGGIGAVEDTLELGDVSRQSAGVIESEGCLIISTVPIKEGRAYIKDTDVEVDVVRWRRAVLSGRGVIFERVRGSARLQRELGKGEVRKLHIS